MNEKKIINESKNYIIHWFQNDDKKIDVKWKEIMKSDVNGHVSLYPFPFF